MEVPDWGDAPGQDYPSLSALAEAPTSLNAQKKAKRKRKQQHTHLQALLDEPIHLPLHQPQNEGADRHNNKKQKISPDKHANKLTAQIQTTASSQMSDDIPASQGAVPVKRNLPASTQSKPAGPQQAKQAAQARLPKGDKQLNPVRTAGGQSATRELQHNTIVKKQSASGEGQQASVKGKKALASGPSGSAKGQQALIDGQPVLLKGSAKGATVTAQGVPASSKGQPLKPGKKQKPSDAIETDSLSKADMAQLMTLVQEASQHNPDAGTPLTSKSTHPVANAAAAATAAVAKRDPKAAGSKQPSKGTASSQAAVSAAAPAAAATTASQSGGSQNRHVSKSSQPKAKKQKLAAKQSQSTDAQSAAAGVSPGVLPAATTASQPAEVSRAGAAAAADEADEAAAAAGAAGSAPGSKQKKKMGRKARLRLKRQAFRQQQEKSGADDAPDDVSTAVAAQSGKVAVAKRATVKAAKGTAEPVNGQLAPLDGQKAVPKGKAAPLNGQSKPASAAGTPEQLPPGSGPSAKKSKKKGRQDLLTQTPSAAGEQLPAGSTDASKKKSKSLLEQMRSKLSGGRFRMLNEQLYTSEGEEAFNMMQGQPDLFQQYHEGFREQTQHWPVQPIDLAISWLKKKSPDWVAADFGCGDAQLASGVPQTVHSFDLVATAPGVTACNMADTPLKNSSVDAAIFCLALMGTDYGSFLTEACRVLRKGGLLWIAEVRSRFADSTSSAESGGKDVFASFVAALKKLGLHVTRQDSSNKMFVVFEAKKVADKKNGAVQWPELKPCMYKRR